MPPARGFAPGAMARARYFPGAAGLPAAIAVAAATAGVSRLGDVTGLDRLGLPVWQAVRPWSRSISVHQGKALTADAARIGAAMEAIEIARAEALRPLIMARRWCDLPPEIRPQRMDDFAPARGGALDDVPLDWIDALPLAGGVPVLVPFASVSLDFGAPGHPDILSESNGQGAHLSLAAATLKGLLELVERDALAVVAGEDPRAWRLAEVQFAKGEWPWLDALAARAGAIGIDLRLFRRDGLAGVPVMQCELADRTPGTPIPFAVGAAAGTSICAALRGAVAEAAQIRLTVIANAREDIRLPAISADAQSAPAFSAFLHRRWLEKAQALPDDAVAALAQLAARLAQAGFAQILRICLSAPDDRVQVVRMIVPGLGSGLRARATP